MTVKETVRENLLNYPLLFKNALDVYDQLFCVCGNGYRWKDGELVSTSKNKVVKTKVGAVFYLIRKFLTDKMMLKTAKLIGFFKAVEINAKRTRTLVSRVLDVDKNIVDFSIKDDEELAKHFKDYKFSFYPLSEFSAICKLPDDIKPDWLEAAKKMHGILVANPDAMDGGERWLPVIKERIEELTKEREKHKLKEVPFYSVMDLNY